MERGWLDFWRADNTFQKSIDQRPADKTYVFYDGPPFITGLPHHGNLLSSIAKDVIPRFWTMRGFRVPRVWGWDCHGLPAENLVEKELGLKDKQAVLDFGLGDYIKTCRSKMVQNGSEWEDTIERIARWVEFRGAYKTMDNDYIESVWWAFKKLYEDGKIYQGEKVLPYCSRCATPVSKAEVAMDNSYKQVTDTSVYVKFPVANPPDNWPSDKPVCLLAWTTTPWTLPANTGLAVDPDLRYRLFDVGDAYCWVGDGLTAGSLDTINKVVAEPLAGRDLVGLKYEPLFDNHSEGAGRVLAAGYLSTQEGTAIVHLAPAYGEEDYDLARAEGLPVVSLVDDNGRYHSGLWAGQSVWEASPAIIDHLSGEGKVFRVDEVKHSYPHCHRCHTRLIYKAHPSWFFDIAGQKPLMLEKNEDINWFPDHVKSRRFPNTINSAPDWNLSRDRFWATPIPVWQGQDENGQTQTIVVGSFEELKELSGQTLDDYHRPFVDELVFEKGGITYRRVEKVLDCWFDSGSMPFAQYHYPFENKEEFEANFPGDFIVEYVGQVRAWFYYLHVLSVALFGRPAFKNVIVTGTIAGSDGQKMSKSLGNYTEPLDVVGNFGADAYRLVLMASPVMRGEDFILVDKDIADTHRKLETLRNTMEFFLLYASADSWPVPADIKAPKPNHCLDRWVLARLNQFGQKMTADLKNYNLPAATGSIGEMIDDLSNWYVRRSRRRFWKTENDADKDTAFETLYFVLVETARYLAPVCPFLAEEIYQNLRPQKGVSVHLADWPEAGSVDEDLIEQMKLVRQLVTDGLAQRAVAGIKVRQPLAGMSVGGVEQLDDGLLEIIKSELNLRQITWVGGKDYHLQLDTNLTDELKAEGVSREIIRNIQNLRKDRNLEVSDRIRLTLAFEESADRVAKEALNRFEQEIKNETLAVEIEVQKDPLEPDNPGRFVFVKPYGLGIDLVAEKPISGN